MFVEYPVRNSINIASKFSKSDVWLKKSYSRFGQVEMTDLSDKSMDTQGHNTVKQTEAIH